MPHENHKALAILTQLIFIHSSAIANDTITQNEFLTIKQEMFSTSGQCDISKLIKSTKTLGVSNEFTIDDSTQHLEKTRNKNILRLISINSEPLFILKSKNREIKNKLWPKSTDHVDKIIFLSPDAIAKPCNSSPAYIEFRKSKNRLVRKIEFSTSDLECGIEHLKATTPTKLNNS